jgi:hypothetical protein
MAITPQTPSLEGFSSCRRRSRRLSTSIVQKASPQSKHAMLRFDLAELINRPDIASAPIDG